MNLSFQKIDQSQLARIQNLIKIFMAFKLGIIFPSPEQSLVLSINSYFKLPSLIYRRDNIDQSFLTNLLTTLVDSPDILAKVYFRALSR